MGRRSVSAAEVRYSYLDDGLDEFYYPVALGLLPFCTAPTPLLFWIAISFEPLLPGRTRLPYKFSNGVPMILG